MFSFLWFSVLKFLFIKYCFIVLITLYKKFICNYFYESFVIRIHAYGKYQKK